MSQPDKEPDKQQARQDYVSEIMELDAKAAERPEPVKKKRSWAPALVVLLPVFIGLTVWNVMRLTSEPEVFPPSLEEASARFTIYLIAQAVEEYRDSTSALPDDLETIDMEEEGVLYEPVGSTYTITAAVGESYIVFQHGQDLEWYGEAFRELEQAVVR